MGKIILPCDTVLAYQTRQQTNRTVRTYGFLVSNAFPEAMFVIYVPRNDAAGAQELGSWSLMTSCIALRLPAYELIDIDVLHLRWQLRKLVKIVVVFGKVV